MHDRDMQNTVALGQESHGDAPAFGPAPSCMLHLDPRLTTLALDQLSFAVLLASENGRVVFANRAGRTLLSGRRDIRLQAGRISAAVPEEDAVLLKAIVAAAGRGRRSILSFSDVDGEMRLAITPLQERGHTSGFAMIFVSAARIATNAIQALREMFDLTGAESSIVAELLAGRTLNEAAAARRISVNTARSHLRAILAKTNTSRQTELLLLLSGVLAFL